MNLNQRSYTTARDKDAIRRMAASIGVSYTALLLD